MTDSNPTHRYRPGDIGYVSVQVPDGARAAAFYAAVLDWAYHEGGGERYEVQGVVPNCAVRGDAGRPDLFCCYVAADVLETGERVRGAGGTVGELQTRPFGVLADCVDDQGTEFALWQPPSGELADPGTDVPEAQVGALSYLTLEVVDAARAREFYGRVLGWRMLPGSTEDGWQVEGPAPMAGISGGHVQASAVPMWRVADVAQTVQRIRAAGGTATDPEVKPYGVIATCTDDQGTRFYVGSA